jgi:hypothetical protein
LEKQTEELHRSNLELEEAVAPRIFEQLQPSLALKKFAGMQVLISSVPDFESQRFAAYLFEVFRMAEWVPQMLPSDSHIMDGILIEWQGGVLSEGEHPNRRIVDTDWNARAGEAAQALSEEFKKQNIAARTFRFPPPREGFPERRPGVPPLAISVKVGVKPVQQSLLEKRFPLLRALREQMEKIQGEAEQRAREMRSRSWPDASK